MYTNIFIYEIEAFLKLLAQYSTYPPTKFLEYFSIITNRLTINYDVISKFFLLWCHSQNSEFPYHDAYLNKWSANKIKSYILIERLKLVLLKNKTFIKKV